jgi:hypothetical protein
MATKNKKFGAHKVLVFLKKLTADGGGIQFFEWQFPEYWTSERLRLPSGISPCAIASCFAVHPGGLSRTFGLLSIPAD